MGIIVDDGLIKIVNVFKMAIHEHLKSCKSFDNKNIYIEDLKLPVLEHWKLAEAINNKDRRMVCKLLHQNRYSIYMTMSRVDCNIADMFTSMYEDVVVIEKKKFAKYLLKKYVNGV